MKSACLFLTVTALLLAGCGDNSSQGSGAETNSAGGNPLTAPVDYLGAMGRAQQTADKTADLTSVNQAIQMFQVEHGRYPKDLDELVQLKFLRTMPEPPYGMTYIYDAKTGRVQAVRQ
jgi:hypothetical protein